YDSRATNLRSFATIEGFIFDDLGAERHCTFPRIVKTGQVARRTTFSVTDPTARRRHPVFPYVAITMRSTCSRSAVSTIAVAASPTTTMARVVRPLYSAVQPRFADFFAPAHPKFYLPPAKLRNTQDRSAITALASKLRLANKWLLEIALPTRLLVK